MTNKIISFEKNRSISTVNEKFLLFHLNIGPK